MRKNLVAVAVVLCVAILGCQTNPQPVLTRTASPSASPNPLTLGYGGVGANGQPEKPMTLAERMALYDIPGVSIAVIRDSRVVWAEGFGVADGETKQPVRPDTLFSAGSISKSLTAMAAMALAEKGAIDLDKDVNSYLVSWKVPENEYTTTEKVTLRRLLSHTAGLPNSATAFRRGERVPAIPTLLDGIKMPVRTPGSQYEYANTGFAVVQQLLMDVTRKPFAQYMQETVLGPLGMTRSTFEQPLPEEWWDKVASWHSGQTPLEGKWGLVAVPGAGGLWTTPSDLATLVIEVMRTYRGESGKVLSRESVRTMLTPQAIIPGGGQTAYGLGFFVATKTEDTRFRHNGVVGLSDRGRAYGSFAEYVGRPDTGQGLVMMINGGGAASAQKLMNEILNRVTAEEKWPG